ncbi:MAG: UDP-N-acetylmuramoyl-L-alanyl-D-glutamate--2,6-diaminopimelate ligase [Chitinispirillaceae bacterium]|nr:UDP-N-acetylmuramoyl-L-alanyl-D-glutamate--2,6-diaminopimelate ligase [Chitinispirillaceae bacterium]
MKLKNLLQIAEIEIVEMGGAGDPEISDIFYDSRKVTQSSLYIAIPGKKNDGDSFIADAVKNGASAIISEKSHPEVALPWVRVKNARKVCGALGRALWNFDLEKITVVGVTGTNGKTTVAHLLQALFQSRHGKENVWMFGTVDYHIGSVKKVASNTTPEALDIYRWSKDYGYPKAVVMEVSSHSLVLDRVHGLKFNVAIWTNLTQDHLDFHTDMESYYAAKKMLFTQYLKTGGTAVVNIDDPWGERLVSEIGSSGIITYGEAQKADVCFKKWLCSWDGTEIELEYNGTTTYFRSKLCGFFNVYNLSATIAAGIACGFSLQEICDVLSGVSVVNGRMERVPLNAPYAVVVDYAHTPDALVNVLMTARTLTKKRLICVFGCGGDRDRTKRPIMGGVVAEYADDAVVTSDNPRSEKPERIIEEILSGIPLDFPHRPIADRREAIRAAMSSAGEGDCVVIAGKGHETYQDINGEKSHFDDKEVAVQVYEELKKGSL